ncbi:putative hydrolase [Phycisphaera mikurensis NBRC 102666]|uniref:Putative hydrolase n=1 Tax=Phycisphaera mikurensis (strain NBRC 102666 / KCTC 22515 / FYK2301M01) TaxID=1142394 RepID=I0IEG8_PHYMF|nr:putative hydrolase [Phycisphaera mikurensis NBRC 102666]
MAAARGPDPLDLLAFNVKLLGQRSAKNVLLSAGRVADKQRLLPAVRALAALGQVEILATPGTHQFLADAGVGSTLIHKITEHRDPNILSFLRDSRIDLVVNVLTGDADYDEGSDAKLIRSLSIRQNIPLITDPQIAEATLLQVVRDQEAGTFAYRVADSNQPWNLRLEFLELCRQHGGIAVHHAHLDKAYLISLANLRLSQVDMQRKWQLYRQLKESYTPDDLIERISRGAQAMVDQGVAYLRTMVDADSICGLMPVKAALEVKKRFADRLTLEVGIQPLEGVLEPASRRAYEQACGLADFCGGLPSRDRPTPEKHLDVILSIARDQGKRLDVHVDQENDPDEHETEMLALKTLEHGMQGRVFAVHSVSLAAQPRHERERVAKLLAEAGVGVIVCPSAALSMKQLDVHAPSHNAIAPVPELLAAGVGCYLGVDNIHDLFLPMVDGDVYTECRFLMEACRFYDLDAVAALACARVAGPA